MMRRRGAPDIVTVLRGGLGNQLFQLAATRTALRAVGGTTALLSELWRPAGSPALADVVGVTCTDPGLGVRMRRPGLSALPGPLRPLAMATARTYARSEGRLLIRPETPWSRAVPLPHGALLELDGYFQHPDWFGGTWREVAGLVADQVPSWYDARVSEQRTVVHVRRGDYAKHGWHLPADYYLAAVDALGCAGEELVVVTDEPAFLPWVAAALRSRDCTVVLARDRNEGVVPPDFWTMAAAARLVMANSTFAWWAGAVAMLRDPAPAVACPDPWLLGDFVTDPLPAFPLPGWTRVASGLGRPK